jgi:hypothetical protein
VAREPLGIGESGGRNILESFWHDLKVALRMVRTKPVFSFTVIGMLALGVAGNTAIFSIFNGLFLRPLPFTGAAQLMDLDETAPKWNLKHVGISSPDFFTWQRANSTFMAMAAYSDDGANFAAGTGNSQRIRTASVTHELLDVLKLTPMRGAISVRRRTARAGTR